MMILALGTTLVARAAAAADDAPGGTPWFPMVDTRGPDETFELNTLAVIRVGDDNWRVNRGKYRESVTVHDFYVTIGRADLARKDRESATLSTLLTVAGWGAVGAGTLLTFAHLSPGGLDPP